jgi:hypothetical protein
VRKLLFVLPLFLLFAFAPSAKAQTCTNSAHCITFTWTASTDAAANPTLGYQLYRSSTGSGTSANGTGICPTTPPATVSAALALGFVLISGATPISGTTYTDNGFPSPPLPFGAYCDFVVATVNGAQSVPSNLVQAVILPGAPTNFAGLSK